MDSHAIDPGFESSSHPVDFLFLKALTSECSAMDSAVRIERTLTRNWQYIEVGFKRQ